jgi:hypothetical protein
MVVRHSERSVNIPTFGLQATPGQAERGILPPGYELGPRTFERDPRDRFCETRVTETV